MKKWLLQWSLPLLSLVVSAPAVAAPPQSIDNEVSAVFYNLVDYHISKPREPQLVTGGLKRASEQLAARSGKIFSFTAADDTLAELNQRLKDWELICKCERNRLNRWAIEGMLETLNDPYTQFFSQEELKQFKESVENEIVGFGFRLRLANGQMLIREVIDDSPAQQAGLKAGDVLVSVDGVSLEGKTFEDVFTFLKGEEGTEATFLVKRPKDNKQFRVVMKRVVLEIPETHTFRLNQDIGFIGLDTFSSDAGYQFSRALASLAASGRPLRGLILDLRDNGGGYLDSARDIASLFLEDGVLMYTTNRNKIEVATWVRNGQTVQYPVSILVNEATASASEMLSGALQDHGVAKLIGSKTFGKGSAQQVVPLPGGNALKITLHEYFTPKHRVVNHVGLVPDVAVEDDVAQVIAGLQELGVRRFDLEEENEQIYLNGGSFPATSPLFVREATGISIRAAVWKQLTGDASWGETGYVKLSPALLQNKRLALQVAADSIRLHSR